jgi:hypothetical protein
VERWRRTDAGATCVQRCWVLPPHRTALTSTTTSQWSAQAEQAIALAKHGEMQAATAAEARFHAPSDISKLRRHELTELKPLRRKLIKKDAFLYEFALRGWIDRSCSIGAIAMPRSILASRLVRRRATDREWAPSWPPQPLQKRSVV